MGSGPREPESRGDGIGSRRQPRVQDARQSVRFVGTGDPVVVAAVVAVVVAVALVPTGLPSTAFAGPPAATPAGPPAPAPAAAQEEGVVVGRPDLSLSAPNNRITWGEQTLSVFVANAGDVTRGGPQQYVDRVTTARTVRITVDEERLSPALAEGLVVTTGQIVAGTVPPGTSGPFEFGLEVNESLAPGTYRLPFEVTYEYTSVVRFRTGEEPQFADSTRVQDLAVTVVVRDRPRLRVAAATDPAVVAGDTATVPLTVTNTGTRTASDATVTLRAPNASLFFGEQDAPRQIETAFVPRLAPGESVVVAATVGAARTTPPGEYPLSAVVSYEDPAGIERETAPLPVGVGVLPPRTFAVRNVTTAVPAEGAGTVSGRVVNTGGSAVRDAVVVIAPDGSGLSPRTTEFAVGTLAPGESAPFSFVVDAPNGTRPGPRVLPVRVRYRNAEGERRTSEVLDARVTVGPARTFAVESVVDSLRVGARGTVTGTVVNTGTDVAREVAVTWRPADPALAPRQTEYAVGTLEPGESAPFSFEVDVANGTAPGPRQVALRVRYRDALGETRTSDPLRAPVSVAPEQRFGVRGVAGTLRVGERGTVRGTVVNEGGVTAREAVVVLASTEPTLSPREREVALGTLAPGESAPFAFTVDATNRTESGPRQLSVRVRYRADGDERASDPLAVPVVVRPEQTFGVEGVVSTLRVGASGTVAGRVVNTGDQTVENAVVVVRPTSPTVVPREREYAVGTLAPGESAPFAFRFDVAAEGEPGPRVVRFLVRYGPADEPTVAPAVERRVTVAPEQTFALANVTSTAQVDASGVVGGTVVNTGPATAGNAVVVFEPSGTGLRPRASEYAVGTLEPGESAPFSFRVDVSNGSAAGPRPATFVVRYRSDGEVATSDPLDATVAVAPAADAFGVTPVDATVPVDGRTVLVANVTNERDERLESVRARLVVADPFESDDASAFVPALAPGETATVRFDLQATDDAVPGTDSVEVRLSYTDAAGDRRTDDPHLVGVTVTGQRGGPVALAPIAAAVVAFAVAVVWWWRRR